MNTIPVKAPAVPLAVAVAVNPTVAKSVARPDAFSKPGTMGKATTGKPGGVRFRALKATRGPGRPRKHARDVRDVQYF